MATMAMDIAVLGVIWPQMALAVSLFVLLGKNYDLKSTTISGFFNGQRTGSTLGFLI